MLRRILAIAAHVLLSLFVAVLVVVVWALWQMYG